ncbi:type II secretion system secretin GspD [Usitatibacter rugosus]|uniref:type II secretion system secretin GspD n=1 Tax=Usitatibacter rugosus TaxID=2732067 RepID=UPI001BB0DDE2|nr:type II secretion system secretin GspD [Usitatibacter rugosus]
MTRFLSWSAALLAALALNVSAQAPQPATPAADERITLNFVNADIQSVIKTISQHTGKNFILDPRVQGTVNIVSDRPVPKDMLYQMLLSALRVQGFAAVEEGGFVKIVPESEAKTSGGPTGEAATRIPGDRIVTQVFLLQNESAVQLVPVLRPLVTANNFIAAYPNNNAIVITDYAENVRRIERIIRSIDLPSGADVQIIKLQNASAVDIGQMLQRVVPETVAPANAPGAQPKAAVAIDPRTNSLVVRADNPNLMNRIKTLALGLDTPAAGSGNIYVVFLRNAEAVRIADTLRGLLSGNETSRSTTTQTTPTGNTATQTTATSTLGSSPGTSGASPLSGAAPSSIIQAYPPTNSIIITAPEPVYRALRQVIDSLDQRRAQVYVEALIVEISTGLAQEFGVQWQGAGDVGSRTGFAGTNFNTGIAGGLGTNIVGAASNFPASLGQGLNLGIIDGTLRIPGTNIEVLNLQVLARALEGTSGANVLSTPNVLTLDNEEAKITVGQNVPFITGSYQTASQGSAANPFQTIERKDIGIQLKVTPQVSEAGAVKLKIFQEVSSITRDKALVQSADIITNKRSLESTVLVDAGQIVVLGGLIQDDQQATIDKVPLLGDIPWIGSLFKYESRNRKRTNLMVFLRPVILKDDKAAASITADRYEYIRGLQGDMKLPWNVLLPAESAKVLPPLEEQKSQILGK